MSALTVGSLFAGIGGFDLGFERAGFEIKWQVEIDPFCRAVLAKHWPDVRRYEDVRKVHGNIACGVDRIYLCENCLEPVDVLCGGFPCQDISVAGKGEGIDGARSGLWRYFNQCIHELRPRYVVVENVSALLGRGIERVLGDLAASGYDAEWDCLPASAFGAPHQRDRVWIVAYTADLGRERPRSARHGRDGFANSGTDVADPASGVRQRPAQGEAGHVALSSQAVANADDQRQLQPQGRIFDQRRWVGDCGWWRTEPHVGRVAHGIPARVDRLRGLGNSIVPQIAQWIAERIKEAESVGG